MEENTKVILNFTEPGSGGPYEEITWYKDQTGRSQYRIVFLHSDATAGEPKYYNGFCSGISPCETSTKVELKVDTGELTIYNVNLSDEGFYYYYFYMEGDIANTGSKYEIDMEVYGKSIHNAENLKVSNMSSCFRNFLKEFRKQYIWT